MSDKTKSNLPDNSLDLSKPVQTEGDLEYPDEYPSEPVVIITTEGRGEFPVIGYIGTGQTVQSWRKDGYSEDDPSWDLINVSEKQKSNK